MIFVMTDHARLQGRLVALLVEPRTLPTDYRSNVVASLREQFEQTRFREEALHRAFEFIDPKNTTRTLATRYDALQVARRALEIAELLEVFEE